MRRAREEGHEGTTAGAAKGGYGGDVGESGSIIDDTPLTDLHESEHDNRIVTSMAASTSRSTSVSSADMDAADDMGMASRHASFFRAGRVVYFVEPGESRKCYGVRIHEHHPDYSASPKFTILHDVQHREESTPPRRCMMQIVVKDNWIGFS